MFPSRKKWQVTLLAKQTAWESERGNLRLTTESAEHRVALGLVRPKSETRAQNNREITMPRALACLLLFFSIPAALVAQTQTGSWSSLSGLKAGQGIEVIESSMKSHNGEFVAVTDELLTLKEHGSDLSLKRVDVIRISTSSGPKRVAHAVIGLVIGGAIGAGIGAAAGGPSNRFLGGSSRGIGALVGLAIGVPSGAAVGAVLPAHTTIYRAAPAAAN